MDRTQIWGRRLLSSAFVALAALGFRSVAAGEGGGLLVGLNGSSTTGCLVGEFTVGYVVDYVTDLDGYGVTGAELTGMGAECEGRTVQVSFTADDGALLAKASALISTPRTAVVLAEPAAIDASQVAGVSVAVVG
ncbi:hypothetical protein [Pengzhenrongella frigida]|uniref:Uncharacterized protein n=1 Tax=Pengzhenrongella frigida TaxID=1259133 RepID=A0A4Q5N3P0_9MICO|nr:hypothetical protein [Cellulomonas sp. HLT2-17]RYV51247.1 hypothetical protein EUA98_09520 [Cellulomonas sp. HLT2-17]